MNALRQDRPESTVEERIARLEAHVEHILRCLADLKADLKAGLERLEARIDKLTQRVDQLEAKYDDKLDKIDARLTRIIYWALGLYIALTATLLGVMARGFHWL